MSTKKILNFDEIKFNYFDTDTEINNIEKPIIFGWISTTGDPFVNDLLKIDPTYTTPENEFNITNFKNNIFDSFYHTIDANGDDDVVLKSILDSAILSASDPQTDADKISITNAENAHAEATGFYTEKNSSFILNKLDFSNTSSQPTLTTPTPTANNIDFYHCEEINTLLEESNLKNKINNICYLYQIYKKFYDSIDKDDFTLHFNNTASIKLYKYTDISVGSISLTDITLPASVTYNNNFKDKLIVDIDSDNILLKCHIDFLNDLIETKKDDPENLKKRIFLYYNIIKILFQVYITDLFYQFNEAIEHKFTNGGDTFIDKTYIGVVNSFEKDDNGGYFTTETIKTEIINYINNHFNINFIQKCKNELLIKNKEKNLFIYGIKSLDIEPIFTKKSSCIFETRSDHILKYVENNTIDKEKFVIIDIDTKNIHNLKNDITITKTHNKYEINLTGHSDICSLNSIKVISKNSYAEKLKYDNLNLELTDLNKKYFEKSDVLDDKQSKNISLNDNYKYINLFYYLTFIIIIFIVGSLLNQSDINKIILYLIITIIIYSLFNVYTETREYFDTEGDIADGINTEIILYVNSLFLIADSKIELYYLYKKLSENTEKELSLKILQDKYIDHNIINEEENINSSWINYYRKIMFIHTLFLMVLVIIIFHLLNSIFSGVTYILLLISIIAFMVILFLYFSKINSIVRTNSKHKYWSNMKI